jgi:hypothetical protein
MQDPDKAARDQDQERGVIDTFPASDPLSGTGTQGPRAVPAGAQHQAPPVADAVSLSRRFDNAESAKLALEELVRSAPLDRDATELSGPELRIQVPRGDAARIEKLLNAA